MLQVLLFVIFNTVFSPSCELWPCYCSPKVKGNCTSTRTRKISLKNYGTNS